MSQADFCVFDLASVGLISQLQIYFVNLGCPGRSNRVTLRLETAARVNGHGPFEVWRATLNVLPSLSRSAEAEILITNNFCDGEAVVELCDIDVLWSNIGHLVSFLRRCLSSLDGGQAFSLVKTERVLSLTRPYNVHIIVA